MSRAHHYTVADLRRILSGKHLDTDMALGVILVDNGILRYTAMTPDNYDYWWYEVEDPKNADRGVFTYSWADMEPTVKSDRLMMLLPLHEDKEDVHRPLNILAQVEAAWGNHTDVMRIYYLNYHHRFWRAPVLPQMSLLEEVEA